MVGLTTAQTYEVWARRTNGTEVLTDELPEGAKLHWIGPRRVDRVILYFSGAHTHRCIGVCPFDRGHGGCLGGGYMLPPREEHFDMLLALQREFKGTVGCVLLNYGASLFIFILL